MASGAIEPIRELLDQAYNTKSGKRLLPTRSRTSSDSNKSMT